MASRPIAPLTQQVFAHLRQSLATDLDQPQQQQLLFAILRLLAKWRAEALQGPLIEATGGGVFCTRGGGFLSATTGVDVPRVSMLTGARVLAGSGWLGLRDREAFVTRGVTVTPMFTGFMALAALLAFISLAWWREGR